MALHPSGEVTLACPYFMPTEKYEGGTWLHPSRLPLGAGWKGYCTAPGFDKAVPDDTQIHESCNLGYAAACLWRPLERPWDSIRFGVIRESERRIVLCYVCEREQRHVTHGELEYDSRLGCWNSVSTHPGIQKMAECYLQSHLLRKAVVSSRSSENS